MKRALAGVVLLMFASFLVSAIRADTVHIAASSTFPIGIAPITQQFLSKSLNGSFDWIGTAASNPVLIAHGPIQGFSWKGTLFDTRRIPSVAIGSTGRETIP